MGSNLGFITLLDRDRQNTCIWATQELYRRLELERSDEAFEGISRMSLTKDQMLALMEMKTDFDV